MFICAFTVSAYGSPEKVQTVSSKTSHPLAEFKARYKVGFQASPHAKFSQSNETHRLESVEHQAWDGETFESYYKVNHNYQNGRRIETQHTYRWDQESGWEVDYRSLYQFENGWLVSVTDQTNIDGTFENNYRILLNYQETSGETLLYETIEESWNRNSSIWEKEDRVQLSFTNGVISGGENSVWINNQWVFEEGFTIEQNGDDTWLTFLEYTGSEWVEYSREVFHAFSVSDLYNFFIAEFDIIETGSFLRYVELLPDYTSQFWSGMEWVNDERQLTIVDYDWQTGELISKIVSIQFYEDDWITTSENRITYEEGMPVEMVLFVATDDESMELKASYAEVFEYNDQDLLQYVIQKESTSDYFKAGSTDGLIAYGRLMLQWSGTSTSVNTDVLPIAFSLGNAYPNPFNPSTVIPFQNGVPGNISIRIFDMLGRNVALIANGYFPAGNHTVRFDASTLSSGVYLVRLDAPGYQQTRRVTLLK